MQNKTILTYFMNGYNVYIMKKIRFHHLSFRFDSIQSLNWSLFAKVFEINLNHIHILSFNPTFFFFFGTKKCLFTFSMFQCIEIRVQVNFDGKLVTEVMNLLS